MIAKKKKKIKPSRLRTIPHASAHLSLWSRCLPATKTHDITIQAQTSSEALLLWSKEDLLLVFPMSYLAPQKVPVTTSAARRPCTWWRSEAILFGQSRRRVAEPLLQADSGPGCNQGVHHLVCTLVAGLPLGRREKLRSEAREWRTQKRKQKKVNLNSSRGGSESEEKSWERERAGEGGERCAPAGRQAVQPLPALGFLGSLKYASYF